MVSYTIGRVLDYGRRPIGPDVASLHNPTLAVRSSHHHSRKTVSGKVHMGDQFLIHYSTFLVSFPVLSKRRISLP